MPLLFIRYSVAQPYPPGYFFCRLFVQLFGIHRFAYAHRRMWSSGFGNFQNLKKFSPQSKNGLQKSFKIFEAILPLFEGNMLYSLSEVVAEYLDLLYRLILGTIMSNLAKYSDIQSLYFARVENILGLRYVCSVASPK